MDRNPDYWRQYRADHPEYAERNRSHQRKKVSPTEPAVLAKIDELNRQRHLVDGIYRITPVQSENTGQTVTWTVELSPVFLERDGNKDACKSDACKART